MAAIFVKKLRLFRSTPPLEKIFFKYFRFSWAHVVFTVAWPDDRRIFLVSCIMSLRQMVSAQRDNAVIFSDFSLIPPMFRGQ
jgi:hypothetical protein